MSEQTQPLPDPPDPLPDPPDPLPDPSPGARHPVSIGHLVMGVALLGLGVVWALVTSDVVASKDIRFLLPAPWILAGVAGLVALVASDRRTRNAQRIAYPVTPPAPPPPSSE